MAVVRFMELAVLVVVGCLGYGMAADLWGVYDKHLREAKYIDLTNTASPTISVWDGFGNMKARGSKAGRAIEGYVGVGDVFTYESHGFVATAYDIPTDQYGTQLDPPSHFSPLGATIDQLPATYSVRPLAVIDVHQAVAKDPGYRAQVSDVLAWEKKYGLIPRGAIVFFRSDWHKRWHETERYNASPFPGVDITTLKLLHEERGILFHGHETLDTADDGLKAETWLLRHDYCQAEGLTNLDKVPEHGALVSFGFFKVEGGTGGYARYIAIAPSDWEHGVTIKSPGGLGPLPRQPHPLERNSDGVMKPRVGKRLTVEL